MEEGEILSKSNEELWNWYSSEVDMEGEEFSKVRKGVDITFDIINYFDGFNINIKERAGVVLFGTKIVRKEDVDTELIKRRRIMCRYLIETYGKRSIASPRGVR